MQKVTPMILLTFSCIKLSKPHLPTPKYRGENKRRGKKKKNCSRNTEHSKGKKCNKQENSKTVCYQQNASLSSTEAKPEPDMLIFSNSIL